MNQYYLYCIFTYLSAITKMKKKTFITIYYKKTVSTPSSCKFFKSISALRYNCIITDINFIPTIFDENVL